MVIFLVIGLVGISPPDINPACQLENINPIEVLGLAVFLSYYFSNIISMDIWHFLFLSAAPPSRLVKDEFHGVQENVRIETNSAPPGERVEPFRGNLSGPGPAAPNVYPSE